MRVSWLIPVRDGGSWLLDAVGSAAAQLSEHDELLLVDDGSQDGAPQAAAQAFPQLTLLSQPALGLIPALERGRRAAKGRFIARLDADDEALPGRIEAQLQRLEAEPRLVAVGGRAEIHRDGEPVPEGMRRYVQWVNGLQDPHRELLVESPLFHPAVTLRAAAVEAVGGYRDDGLPEDYDLWLRLVRAGGRIANLERGVLRIRDRPERLTRTHPRYSHEAFRRAKQLHLERTLLREPTRVVVAGAGRTGKRWLRWLLAQGHPVVAVLDPGRATERQGVPVLPTEALATLDVQLLLSAVGSRGGRQAVREAVGRLRPKWQEGRDWMALA